MMCTIKHAYLTVGLAGMAAFMLLGVFGPQHALAAGELGGTEVLMSDALRPGDKTLHGLPQIAPPKDKGVDHSHGRLGGWPEVAQEISVTQ